MPRQRVRFNGKWSEPGKVSGKRKYRYCKICGATADKVKIMKIENICEHCARELERKKEGHLACKGCGKVVPKQVKQFNGYCEDCVCRGCGKPDPRFARKLGFCRECLAKLGTHCRVCGKEAPSQVKKNEGVCDECLAKGKTRRSEGPEVEKGAPMRATRARAPQGRVTQAGGAGERGGQRQSAPGGAGERAGQRQSAPGGAGERAGQRKSAPGGAGERAGQRQSAPGGAGERAGQRKSGPGGAGERAGQRQSGPGGAGERAGQRQSAPGGAGERGGQRKSAPGGAGERGGQRKSAPAMVTPSRGPQGRGASRKGAHQHRDAE